MTNFEYYKKEILEIAMHNDNIGLVNNKPVTCSTLECHKCSFGVDNDSCRKDRFQWLYKEHKETPKLTKKERQFCELVETGWIARNKDGSIYLRDVKPSKFLLNNYWGGNSEFANIQIFPYKHLSMNFSFISWEDEEPWSIEELLKLEVEE